MPMSLEEFQIGQLYCVAFEALNQTDGDSKAEILENRPFTDERGSGQYTEKIMNFGSKIPTIVAMLLSESSKMVLERSWNTYPNCHTEYSNSLMNERFSIIIDTIHVENDYGQLPNVRLKYYLTIHFYRSLIYPQRDLKRELL